MSDHTAGPRFDDGNNRILIVTLLVAAGLATTALGSFGNSPSTITIASLGNLADLFTPTSFGNLDSAPSVAVGASRSFGNLDQAPPHVQWVRSDCASPVRPIGTAEFVRQFSIVRPDYICVFVRPRDSS